MTSNKCLQIVILSYNRSKSLKDQINEFERLGYFSNPRVDFVIQDNNSDDDTEIVLDSVRQLGLGIRRFENNVGYARSYLKAHELCDFEYLWIVGDDLPAINALTLLLYIDGFQQDLIYYVFRGMPNSLPILPVNSFLNSSFVDINVNRVLSIDSNFTGVIGGFVSGVIWNNNLIKGVVSRYINLLSNEVLTSYSPQVLIVPLFIMESIGCHDKKDYCIRVYRESITNGPTALSQGDRNKNDVLPILRKIRWSNISKIFKSDFGMDTFIRATIWIHMSYVICDFYGSQYSIKKVSKNHLYPMAYHFSIFYKPSNFKSALVLLVAGLRRFFFVDYSYGKYTRFDCAVFIYRLLRCQWKGTKIKQLFLST